MNEFSVGQVARRYGPTVLDSMPWGRLGWSKSEVSGEGSVDNSIDSPFLYHRYSAVVVNGEEFDRRDIF